MKETGGPPALDLADIGEAVVDTPKRKQGSERMSSCPLDCPHDAPLPSDTFIEMKVCCLVVTEQL